MNFKGSVERSEKRTFTATRATRTLLEGNKALASFQNWTLHTTEHPGDPHPSSFVTYNLTGKAHPPVPIEWPHFKGWMDSTAQLYHG